MFGPGPHSPETARLAEDASHRLLRGVEGRAVQPDGDTHDGLAPAVHVTLGEGQSDEVREDEAVHLHEFVRVGQQPAARGFVDHGPCQHVGRFCHLLGVKLHVPMSAIENVKPSSSRSVASSSKVPAAPQCVVAVSGRLVNVGGRLAFPTVSVNVSSSVPAGVAPSVTTTVVPREVTS